MTVQENLTTIEPVNGPLVGSISVPGDKSISHRAVLFAAMAEGISRLSGVLSWRGKQARRQGEPGKSSRWKPVWRHYGLGREGPQRTERSNRLWQFRHHDALAHGNFGPVGY